MNLKTFLTTQYWFQINPAFISPAEKLFLFAGVVFILLAIALKISAVLATIPVDKIYREKFYHLFLTMGICELIWYGCRYENVLFFDSHFVAWLIVLIAIIWMVALLVTIVKKYSQEKQIWEKEMVKRKYLPHN